MRLFLLDYDASQIIANLNMGEGSTWNRTVQCWVLKFRHLTSMTVKNFISLKTMLPYPQISLDQLPIDYHICKHLYNILNQKPSRCKENSKISLRPNWEILKFINIFFFNSMAEIYRWSGSYFDRFKQHLNILILELDS